MPAKKVTSTVSNSAMPVRTSSKKQWTKAHNSMRLNLFTKWKDAHPDTQDTEDDYIYNNKRHLHTFVDRLKQSNSTAKGNYFMIVRWLEINYPGDRYIKIFQNHGYELGKLIQHEEDEGLQTNKEIENYRHLGDLRNILEILKEDHITTYPYLLLAMVVLQPTLRGSFYANLKIISQRAQNDGVQNCIFINRQSRKIMYIVNNDKVSNSHEFGNYKNSEIEIEDPELKKLIIQSVTDKPRVYMFQNPKTGESYSYSALLNMLHRITGISGIGFNMFRSSHVNDLYNSKSATINDKKILAKKMRHSISSGQSYYHKIFNEDETEPIDIIRTRLQMAEDREASNIKNNDQATVEKKKSRQRKDTVAKINKRGSNPSQKTIEAYNLVQNDDGIWS